jgi:hypothetical protein
MAARELCVAESVAGVKDAQVCAKTRRCGRRQKTPRPRLRKDERKGIRAIESVSCLNACQRISSRPKRHDTIRREMNVVRGNLVR